MPKTAVILIFLIFLSGRTLPNESYQKVDSLENELKKPLNDSLKLVTYYRLSTELFNSDLNRAFEYAVQIRKLAEETGNRYYRIQGLLLQCDFYTHIGDYNTAFELAYEALDIAQGYSKLTADSHNRIAIIHAKLGNNLQSLNHNRISFQISSKRGDSAAIMLDLHNMGTDYNELGKYDSALYILRLTNAYEIRNQGHPDPYSLTNLGNTFLALHLLDSALYYHQHAYQLDQECGNTFETCLDELALAETYLKYGDYENAKRFAFKAKEGMDRYSAHIDMSETYEILCRIFEKEGNYQEAFSYSQLYNTLRDSLYQQGKASLILGLETKHRVKEQAAKLKLLTRQKKLFLILTLISALFLVSMVVMVVIIYRRQTQYRALLTELQNANSSKERLLSIISHDLRGSVGGLRTASKAIAENLTDPESSIELMSSFFPVADSIYDLLENLLIWAKCNKEDIRPVFEELNIRELVSKSVEHTVHIAQAKSIELINNTLDVFVYTDRNMLLSVIRNLLSNAIKFSHARSRVTINQEITNDEIIIAISDEGIGMNEKALARLFDSPESVQASGTLGERGSGLGLHICKTFLDSLGCTIWAESRPEWGTTFFFTIPLTK